MYQQDETAVDSPFMKEFLTLAKGLIIPRTLRRVEDIKIPEEFHSLQFNIDPDKAAQTYEFLNFILERVSEPRKDIMLLDFGAGKGYLSQCAGYDYGLKSVAIEASERHAISLCRRNASL